MLRALGWRGRAFFVEEHRGDYGHGKQQGDGIEVLGTHEAAARQTAGSKGPAADGKQIWLTRTARCPSARARYHAKKPIHIGEQRHVQKARPAIAPMLEGTAYVNHQATGSGGQAAHQHPADDLLGPSRGA